MHFERVPWPKMAMLAGAVSLAFAAVPALAQPGDDDDNAPAPPPARHDIHVYHNDNEVQGAFLGVRVQEVTKELQEARDLPTSKGALVNSVEPGSPADKAGLKRWDLIIELDRATIDQPTDLIRKVRSMDPGEPVSIVVMRDGERQSFPITLATRPKNDTGTGAMPDFRGTRFNNSGALQQQIDRLEQELSQLRAQDQRLEREIRDLRDSIQPQGRDQDDRPQGNNDRGD